MAKRPHEDLNEHSVARKCFKSNPRDRLSALSDELLLRALSHLPVSTLILCQRLSHRLNVLAGDSQIWKQRYYERFVRPRASRIPGIRDQHRSASSLYFSSKISRWLEDDHLVKGGQATNWKKQYKLRHNWSRGSCDISEVQVAERPSAPPLLVRLYGEIVITVDGVSGLRAWSIKGQQRLIATLPLGIGEASTDVLVGPTSLAIDNFSPDPDKLTIAVGFANGTFGVFALKVMDRVLESLYTHPPSPTGSISAIAYTSPYLLTMTDGQLLSLYTFVHKEKSTIGRLGPPRLSSSLKSYTAWPPLSLSIRGSSSSIIASIAYAMPTYLSGWSVGLQELRISPEGNVLESRISSALNQGFAPFSSIDVTTQSPKLVSGSSPTKSTNMRPIPPSTKPTTLSYTHPYLLAAHPDNTLTLYLVTSNSHDLKIGPANRLWGHTSSVSGAHIGDRGRAVSVSTRGNEIRVWELEGGPSSFSSRRGRPIGAGEVSVQVQTERRIEAVGYIADQPDAHPQVHHIGLGTSKAHDVDAWAITKNWVAFDEEKVVVLREKNLGSQALVIYDFS